MNSLLYPLVIILTHRRGAALALLKKEDDQNPIFIRILGKTAENLLDSYNSILKVAKLNTRDIQTLAVGVGPGSFTGLRLGCAFANGIKLGQNCHLIPIKTELASYFLNLPENFFSNNPTQQDLNLVKESENDLMEFRNQLGDYNPDDESSGFVTFFDLLDAIEKLKMNASEVNVLEPNYGKEPGPVLKLKETMNEQYK